uniref:hypothetical protein n=1 Tax=Salmonella sp. SAL4432 TaxID=3159887 RepID=UPI00397E5649
LLWGVAEILGEAVLELGKAPFRRKKKPVEPERGAEERRADSLAEVLAEARARTPDRPDPDPHILKLPRAPTPPRADRARYRAGRDAGAS